MNRVLIFITFTLLLFSQSSCNSRNKITTLQKCTTLGNESILYARANYIKLFNIINPDKFSDSYQKVKNFDHVRHRNVINTYDIAVRKLKEKDPISKRLIKSCKALAEFSTNFVDQSYPRAITFKEKSKMDPLTDNFFLEINKIVKFDHTIGHYKKSFTSFKKCVEVYEDAVKQYVEKYKSELEITSPSK